MRIAYFDCFHGAAGDMLLASLLDAGLNKTALEEVLALLPLTGYRLEHQQVVERHISGSRLTVVVEQPQPFRTWADLRNMLKKSDLPERTRRWALGAFERLAQAEATVHGTSVEYVHFHEVGALDSIIDMVGFCAGLEILGIEQIYASPLPLGSGWVSTQHGLLPVPAPATMEVLATVHAPVVHAASAGEILTPTAAALLAELAEFTQPALHLHRIGYGFGQKTFDRLNGLRVWIGKKIGGEHAQPTHAHGHSHEHTHAHEHEHEHGHEHSHPAQPVPDHTQTSTVQEQVVELCCNLDDATGEVIAYTVEQLLAAGALDAWSAPLTMKKGRPAVQLSCLALPTDVDTLAHLLLRETTTFGVRWQTMERLAVGRQFVSVATPWGSLHIKQKVLDGKIHTSMPEYEECAALARTHNIPLATVQAHALARASQQE
jgi:hypothetical protein